MPLTKTYLTHNLEHKYWIIAMYYNHVTYGKVIALKYGEE